MSGTYGSLLILAGGLGLRMGENKLFLQIDGEFLIAKIFSRLSPLFDETLLLAAKGAGFDAERRLSPLLERYGVRVVEDRAEGRGPLEGLCRSLASMRCEHGFLIGCDMPCVDTALLSAMSRICCGADVVTAEINGYLEPLHAFYGRRALPFAEAALERGRGLKSFYKDVRLAVLSERELASITPGYKRSFTNLNTPRDFARMSAS